MVLIETERWRIFRMKPIRRQLNTLVIVCLVFLSSMSARFLSETNLKDAVVDVSGLTLAYFHLGERTNWGAGCAVGPHGGLLVQGCEETKVWSAEITNGRFSWLQSQFLRLHETLILRAGNDMREVDQALGQLQKKVPGEISKGRIWFYTYKEGVLEIKFSDDAKVLEMILTPRPRAMPSTPKGKRIGWRA